MTQQGGGQDRYNFALYVPEIKHEEFRVTDEGKVVLDLEVTPAKKLMGRLVNRTPVSDIEFDGLSSSAWLSIDGARSILDIARLQSETTGDGIDESAQRVAKLMRYLAKRGWIRFKRADTSQ